MKNYLLALFALFAVAITAPQVQAQPQITLGCPVMMDGYFDASGTINLTGESDVPNTTSVSSGYSISSQISGGGFIRQCVDTSFTYDSVMQAWVGASFWLVFHAFDGMGSTGSDSCQIDITVRDNSGPILSPRNISVALNAVSQTVTVNPLDVLTTPATDQCHRSGVVTTINGQSSVTFNTSNLGANTVTISSADDAGNVSTATAVVTVTVASSVQQLTAADWRVYPNPVGEVLYVDLGSRGLAEEKDLRLSLRAVDGREIWTAALPEGSQISEWQLPASLPQGAYFLHLSGKNASGVMKLMR